ncbi:MAG: carboxypeptidase regulatory-like domain-containing protein [Bdellovibrionales bacterium]|nr:carboxypeptidase regulatory-like domain-containing protein [Bdellovibrionales bacterium]
MNKGFLKGIIRPAANLAVSMIVLSFLCGCAGGGTGGTGVKRISGKVINSDGLPLAGALVEIVDIQESKVEIQEPVVVVGSDVTDSNGEFEVMLGENQQGDGAVVTVETPNGGERRSAAAIFDRVASSGQDQRVTIAVSTEENEAVIVSEEIVPLGEAASAVTQAERETQPVSTPRPQEEAQAEPVSVSVPEPESTPEPEPEAAPEPVSVSQPAPEPSPLPEPVSVPVNPEVLNPPQGNPLPDPDPDPEPEPEVVVVPPQAGQPSGPSQGPVRSPGP